MTLFFLAKAIKKDIEYSRATVLLIIGSYKIVWRVIFDAVKVNILLQFDVLCICLCPQLYK